MNIYNILKIKHVSNIEIPPANFIEDALNRIATPAFEKLGLKNNKHKYIWEGNYNTNEIKNNIRFSYRGPNVNFMIGKNFKFIPILNNKDEIKYKTNELQLFENIEYFDNKNGISLWNKYFFEKTLKIFIKNESNRIHDLFRSSIDINGNIEIALRQIQDKNSVYDIRYPNPKYVLAFLYAKNGEKEKGKRILKELMEESNKVNCKLLLKLDNI